jgi:hypothetical protein
MNRLSLTQVGLLVDCADSNNGMADGSITLSELQYKLLPNAVALEKGSNARCYAILEIVNGA